ncbi:hypothetical protein [Parasphingorhabdus cellanae]|uniref:C-type lysozyme inhibitor domain-containing protein n=1 Tax=Parasphingorhabdus cellanae TaxID=2806553 RepID=A0ABX7T1S4_9SPHN|nr:hypothetical protein [Parasphingorhabdus cellanae]QTD54467.1 hypothetical protein J4G78_09155 [Parasphingorhabdus cellanae]
MEKAFLVGRRLAHILTVFFFAASTPAVASIVDQYNCVGDEHRALTVLIAGQGAPPAVVRLDDMSFAKLERVNRDLKSTLGGGVTVYASDKGTFVVISDKAVLKIGGKTHFCEIIGEEPDLSALLPAIELDGNGFELQRPGIPSSRYDFGTDAKVLVAVLGRYLGTPQDRVTYGEAAACPSEVVKFARVTVYFADDRWAGWALNNGTTQVSHSITVSGPNKMKIGTPASVLQYSTKRYEDSTLGDERVGGGVHYLVKEQDRSSEIGAMWAGAACVFR